MDILFARKAFTIGIHSFLDTNTFANRKDSFPFSFLPFVSWTLKMAVSNFECQFSLCHSHIHNLNRALVGMWRSTTRVRVTLFRFESGHYLCLLSKMSLLTQLTDLFFTQNLSSHAIIWSACISSALSFFLDWFSCPYLEAFTYLFSVLPMTGWKDSTDSWKDSRLPRQLRAVSLGWKIIRYQLTESEYMFNYKLRGSARLAYLAGSTPQRQFLLAATIPRWWSKHSLQINFFIFFCPSKALQIKTTKRQFPPDSFLHLLTERYIRFWKELRIHRLLYSHILSYKSKMLYGIVSNLAGITPQSRFSFRLHHPLMVFPDLHFTKWIFFLPARLLL